MRLLLDTHILIWLANDPDKLSAEAKELIGRTSTVAFVSSVTFWELRLKWQNSRAAMREELIDPAKGIALAEGAGFHLAPLAPADCVTPLEVPLAHRDPFDEQLLIHARQLNAKLLTRDRQLIGHPLALTIS